MEFKNLQLEDVIVLEDKKRKPLSTMDRSKRKGIYPYYGAQEIIDSIDDYIFDGKYIILAEDGENLKSRKKDLVKIVEGKFWLNNHAHIFKVKEDVDLEYLYYYLLKLDLSEYITGSTQPKLNQENMNKIKIKLPGLKIQKNISKILSNIDGKIKLNNEINNNLHEIAENLFKYVYEKGKKCKLQELISNVSTGSRPKGGAETSGIPSVGAEKIEKFGIYNYSSEKYISEEYFNKLKTGIIKSGDVLLYKDGAYTGKVSMALNGFPHDKCAANEHVFIINTEDNWAKYYLYFTLYNQENRNKIFTMASSKAAQPGLNQSELKTLDIKLADKKEIIKFEKKVESIMFKIAHNTLQNKILERLRDTLLPKLMNGEIDLDNIEI